MRVFTAFLILALAGCAIPTVEETRQTPEALETSAPASMPGQVLGTNEVITVIGDEGRAECLQAMLASRNGKLKFIGGEALSDALFPWFEDDDLSEAGLKSLLDKPLVKRRIDEIGLRYIVTVSEIPTGPMAEEINKDNQGGILCGAGSGGGGCLGFVAWERQSSLSADLFDIKNAVDLGSFSAKATGISTMPAFILPIPFISPTKSAACGALAKRLDARFRGIAPEEEEPARDAGG